MHDMYNIICTGVHTEKEEDSPGPYTQHRIYISLTSRFFSFLSLALRQVPKGKKRKETVNIILYPMLRLVSVFFFFVVLFSWRLNIALSFFFSINS